VEKAEGQEVDGLVGSGKSGRPRSRRFSWPWKKAEGQEVDGFSWPWKKAEGQEVDGFSWLCLAGSR